MTEQYDRVVIYALADPETGQVGYVGQSSDPVKRFGQHLSGVSRGNPEKDEWIRNLGCVPDLLILEELNRYDHKYIDREQYWIEYYLQQGHPLTNKATLSTGRQRPWACSECGRSDIPHKAHGLCQNCYMQRYRQERARTDSEIWQNGLETGLQKAKQLHQEQLQAIEQARQQQLLEVEANAGALREEGREQVCAALSKIRGIECYIHEDTVYLSSNNTTLRHKIE